MNRSPVCCAVAAALMVFPALAEEAAELSEVVVTANRIDQPLSKTAGSVAVVDGEQLEREGATELYDALNKEPGVAVTGGAGRPQNIVIRGMTGNRIAVVQDGIKVTDGYGANDLNDSVGRNAFDLGEVKQLEVVKGASSSVQGSGAIGGVVVVTSKTPEDYLQGEDLYMGADATYSGLSNRYRGAGTLAFRQGDFDSLLRVSGWSGEETGNYDKDLYNRDIDGYSAAYTLHHYYSDSLLLKGKVDYYREDTTRREGSALTQPDGLWHEKSYFEETQVESTKAYLGFEHEQESGWYQNLDAKGYWRLSTHDAFRNVLMYRDHNGINEQRRQVETRSFEDELVGASVALDNRLLLAGAEHQLAYGLTLESVRHARPIEKTVIDWNGTQPSEYVPFVAARTHSAGIYFRDAISWGQWQLTPGLRFDMHRLSPDGNSSIGGIEVSDSDNSELSPSLSLAYQWTPDWNTYVSYNHGYRAPSYDKVYGYSPHLFNPLEPFILVPNLDLKAETSDSFEIGSKLSTDRWQFYVALFYSDFKDFIDVATAGFDEDNGYWLKQYRNRDEVETYGAELTLTQQLTPAWSWTAKAGVVSGKDDEDEYVRSITPWEGSVQLDYLQDALSGYARLNWAASMDKTPSCENQVGVEIECATTAGWGSVDLGASYHFDFGLDLSLNLINLLDKKYIRYQDVAGLGPHQVGYATQSGRYATVNAKMVF